MFANVEAAANKRRRGGRSERFLVQETRERLGLSVRPHCRQASDDGERR